MTIGDPIEAQCVKMWKLVFGHNGMSMDMARSHFWCQNPSNIEGWEKLAKSMNRVTTSATLEHVSSNTQ